MDADSLGVRGSDKPLRQRGGHAAAQALLESFLDSRASDYRQGMSSPLTAQDSCSRLSPFIAYGVVSVRMVVHALHDARAFWLGIPAHERPLGMLQSLKSFESRLHWHCHFIQKLESQPDIEYHNLHRAYNGLRPEPDPRRLAAWCEGRTGVPMVDACMRMLLATGWINFRMRAMLMSFSSYHLWQHWREPALHLAREFLDYEPGIHYPQVQMQSGTTGINTIRIYSPTKQALDQDPEGEFIRLWCPELKRVPTAYLAEPWTMPDTLQQHLGVVIGRDYPAPVVDVAQAGRFARDTMWALRGEQKRTTQFRAQTQEILAQHASRDPGRSVREQGRRSQRKNASTTPSQATRLPHTPAPQMDLFGALNED
jgi:deoxyribodipyrimidine photo-lyase